MQPRLFISAAILTILLIAMTGLSLGGGNGPYQQGPELDHTLMGFKEQGAWYFPCVAPQYPVRFGPAYVTYGPPPPPCGPVPCAPALPMKVK